MAVSSEFQKRLIEIVSDMECNKTSVPGYLGITYFSYERAYNYGIIPSPKILMRIADKLNISVEYLLGRTDKEEFYRTDNPVSFFTRLEQLKDEKRMTYYELYKKTSIGTNYFANWKKRNSIPTLEHLIELSMFFKVSLDYLLGRTDDK